MDPAATAAIVTTLAVIALAIAAGRRGRARQEAQWRALAERLGGRYQGKAGPFGGERRLRATVEGVVVDLAWSHHGKQQTWTAQTAGLRGVPAFTIRPRGALLSRGGPPLGVHEELDRRFAVTSDDPERLGRLLTDDVARRLLRVLAPPGRRLLMATARSDGAVLVVATARPESGEPGLVALIDAVVAVAAQGRRLDLC